MGEPSIDSLHDQYEDQLSAARYKAERDAAVQELQAMRERNLELWMESGMANELVTCAEQKAERLGKLVWRLQNRLARSHRREKALRKGMRMWREKVIGAPVRTVSAYDLLPQEERDAIAWVREHGGLDRVKAEWRSRSNLKRQLERAQAKVERQQRHIEFVQRKCRERLERIAALNKTIAEMRPRLMPEGCDWEFLKLHMSNLRGFMLDVMERLGVDKSDSDAPEIAFDVLDRRLMPEGYEWPRYEDGGPVRIGDVVNDVEVRSVVFRDGGILLSDCTSVPGWGTWRSYKEPIKRPAVLAGDGEPLVAGQMVYHIESGDEFTVTGVDAKSGDANLRWGYDFEAKTGSCAAELLTHRAPVLAADGKPLREGEHVYHVETGAELVVKGLPKPGEYQAVVVFALPTSPASHLTSFDPDQLTHERPDTWERIEEDAGCTATKYNERRGTIFTTKQQVARDLVRRCRALAERERGE